MLSEITLSADDELIRKAQKKAARESTSLNELFGAWLRQYVSADSRVCELDAVMQSMDHVQPGKAFSRDEMNERWGYSYYDSLIIAAALQADCDTLYSEDLHNEHNIMGLTFVNPFVGR